MSRPAKPAKPAKPAPKPAPKPARRRAGPRAGRHAWGPLTWHGRGKGERLVKTCRKCKLRCMETETWGGARIELYAHGDVTSATVWSTFRPGCVGGVW